MLISIEGNIGSGKSTILNILKNHFRGNNMVVFIDEPVEEWKTIVHNDKSVLEHFYENKETYSFCFQILTYITRLRKIIKTLEENRNKTIICERSIYTDKYVFARMLYEQKYINEIEWQTYNYWFDTFKNITKLDHIIYIKTDPDKCFNRIKKRNRKGESDIPILYLNHCDLLHNEWLIDNKNMTLFDGNIELKNEDDYIKPVLRILNSL